MKIEISTVKGFQDYLPPESLKRKAIVEIVTKNFELFGFQPIETPIIEFDELMKSQGEGEDEAVSDRFRLTDKGNRPLGLRYEFTFQLARIFKEKPTIKLPFKRYQIGPVFRDEPTGTGRFRQFTQCDIDIVGDSSMNADAECIAAFSEILKKLKINAEIKVNNRALLNSLIESVQIGQKDEVMRELDKIEKIGPDVVKANLRKYTSSNQILTLFKLLEKDLKFFKENSFNGVDELESFMSKCRSYGIKVKFNPFMIRGLGYYTGNIFEIIPEESKSSIAAGGRYDNVVGKYLPMKIPAVGISFGLERLSKIADVKIKPSVSVLVLSINQDKAAIKLVRLLRKSKISCSLASGKPSKSLDYANSLGIPYVVFLGENEISKGKFKLKDMGSGAELMLSEKQLLKKLK